MVRTWHVAALAALALGLAGCELILGIDDAKDPGSNNGGDAGIDQEVDAAPPRIDGGTSQLQVLGVPCGPDFPDTPFGGDCPPPSVCVTRVSNFSDNGGGDGYCSPICDGDNSICVDSYAGPPATLVGCFLDDTGAPALSGGGTLCAISCADADPTCPDQLVCFDYDDGSGGVIAGCGGPTWVMDPVL